MLMLLGFFACSPIVYAGIIFLSGVSFLFVFVNKISEKG